MKPCAILRRCVRNDVRWSPSLRHLSLLFFAGLFTFSSRSSFPAELDVARLFARPDVFIDEAYMVNPIWTSGPGTLTGMLESLAILELTGPEDAPLVLTEAIKAAVLGTATLLALLTLVDALKTLFPALGTVRDHPPLLALLGNEAIPVALLL